MDSYYWGKISWTIGETGFRGQWSYCDQPLAGSWSGTRIPNVDTTAIAPYRHANMPSVTATANAPPNSPMPPSLIGTTHWSTTEGAMTAVINGNQFTSTYRGSYEGDNGRMAGTTNGNVFEGYWGENSSQRACDTERLGTYYWGRIRLVFSANRFVGQWSYCDLELGGEWKGIR
jgi:hypothetical protein